MLKDRSYHFHFGFLSGIFLVAIWAAVITSLYWLAIIPFGLLLFYFGWGQRQFVFFLLIFSLPWSIEYNFSQSLGTDLPDEPLMLLTSLLLIAQFTYRPSGVTRAWRHPLTMLLIIYYGWLIVTVPFSTDWLVSLKFLLAKSWYIIAFVLTPLLIFENKASLKNVAALFLISMMCVVIIILCRQASGGFRFVNITEAVSPFFRNHVNYSSMLVCVVPVLAAARVLSKRLKVLITIAMVVVAAALFLSYARGAWLALLVGLIAYWLIRIQKLLLVFIISFVFIVAAGFWLSRNDRYLNYSNHFNTTIFHTDFKEHLIATYRLKDLSTAERFNRWVAGIRMVKDNWLTGYGPNTFYNNYKPYSLPAFKTWVSDNREHSTVHNYFLLTLIEEGIPGLLFFILLTGGMLYYAERLYNRVQDRFYKTAAIACGVMVVMIVTVNFLSDLIETDKVGSLFFLCFAALVAIDKNSVNKLPGAMKEDPSHSDTEQQVIP